jgi:hypothetical protein
MWPHFKYIPQVHSSLTFIFRLALPAMPSTQSATFSKYDMSIRSTRSERPSSGGTLVSRTGMPPSQHFALATGMANPFAGSMGGFRTSRAKSASAVSNCSRESTDRVGMSPLRRYATTNEDLQKDIRAKSISEGSTTIIKCTRNANTSQSKLPLPYPISYRLEVLDRHACYFVYMA